MEEEFAETIRKRGPDFKFCQVQIQFIITKKTNFIKLVWQLQDMYGEHPEERAAKIEEKIEKLGDVLTLSQVFINLKAKVSTKIVFSQKVNFWK